LRKYGEPIGHITNGFADRVTIHEIGETMNRGAKASSNNTENTQGITLVVFPINPRNADIKTEPQNNNQP
jgi:hypothetical protein